MNPAGWRTLAAVAVWGVVVAALPRPVHACAGCRNPSLPVSRGSEGPLSEGALRLGASLTSTAVNVVHEAGCADLADCSEAPVQPLHLHDQDLYPVELRISAEYGISALLGVEAQVPFRAVGAGVHYTTPDGDPYEPLDPGIHHRDEVVAGFADPWLLLRIGDHLGILWLAARVGVSLPVGSTEEDPFALGDQGLEHQHIQLGSGTFDPMLVLELGAPLDTANLLVFAQTQLSLYENSHGHKAPARMYGGTSVGHMLVGTLYGTVALEASHETPENWSGVVRQDGNLGRTELLAGLGFAYGLGDASLSLDVRFTLVRHIVEGDENVGTISAPVALTLGYTQVFGNEERARAL